MLKDILVHMDTEERSLVRLETAMYLARTFSARLTGVYVRKLPHIPMAYAATPLAPAMPMYSDPAFSSIELDQYRRLEADNAAQTKQTFEQTVTRSDIEHDWRDIGGEPDYALAALTACYDLVIVSQRPPDETRYGMQSELGANLALYSGRPILVIPHTGSFPRVGEHIAIAWNGGREAARAVHDALPLLQKAQWVTVLSVVGNAAEKETEQSGAELSAHLNRHNASAQAMTIPEVNGDVGTALLSYLQEHGCDLLVMGAYGHSRLRELIIGGVTRQVLRHTSVPVLITH